MAFPVWKILRPAVSISTAAMQCRAHAERVRERGGEQKGFSLLPAKKHTEIIVCIVCALLEADSLGLNKKSRDV